VKLALGLRFDREVERLLVLQNGALRRAAEGREALPVHAKYAIATSLGWPLDPPTVLAMLSDVQREKVKKMSKHFEDVTLVRVRRPRVRRGVRRATAGWSNERRAGAQRTPDEFVGGVRERRAPSACSAAATHAKPSPPHGGRHSTSALNPFAVDLAVPIAGRCIHASRLRFWAGRLPQFLSRASAWKSVVD
jgi:hypothetical protein